VGEDANIRKVTIDQLAEELDKSRQPDDAIYRYTHPRDLKIGDIILTKLGVKYFGHTRVESIEKHFDFVVVKVDKGWVMPVFNDERMSVFLRADADGVE